MIGLRTMERKKLNNNEIKDAVNFLKTGNTTIDREGLKRKEVGLSLVMLSLAEATSRRMTRLTRALEQVEERIFDEENMKNFTPYEIIGLYKLACQSMEKGSDYIKTVVGSLDWGELELQIELASKGKLEGKEVDEIGKNELAESAGSLLSLISSFKEAEQKQIEHKE